MNAASKEGRDIVIRSPNWIGDCIMALPAIRALKDHLPQTDIYLAAKQHLCDIYKNIEEIKEIIPIPGENSLKAILKASGKLRTYGFQRGILFTNSFSSAFLFKLAGIGKLIGYSKDLRGFLLDKKIPFPRDNKHHIYFYLDLAEAFLKEETGKKIDRDYSNEPVITNDEWEKVSAFFLEIGIDLGVPLVGISSSAAYGSAKEWLPERFGELIQRILQEKPAARVLLFGSSKEKEKISRILEFVEVENRGNAYNLAGRLSLRETIVAISLCNLFISNDSGLMHVASSLDLPLIALFGPTKPHKTAPLNKNARTIHYPVDCAPCNHRECPLDHRCMNAIPVDEVFDALVPLLPQNG